MTKAVLWDLDGVLVDTAPFHFQAWRELFAGLGKRISEQDFVRTFGLRNDAILKEHLGDLPPQQVEELSRRKEELFRDMAKGNLTPAPGVIPLLRRLRQGGSKMAVVSSTPRENLDMVLRSLGLETAFDALIVGEDVERGKPDPQGYLLAAERLNVDPRDCVVIEDAPGGVEAAKRAGMSCIGLAADRAPDTLAGADLIANSLEEESVRSFLEV